MESRGVDSAAGSEKEAHTIIEMAVIDNADASLSKVPQDQNNDPDHSLAAGHNSEIEEIVEEEYSTDVNPAASPENPELKMQMTEKEVGASSSKGPQKKNGASDNLNLPILDLLPSKCENRDQYFSQCVPLHQAALKGDWERAKDMINRDQSLIRTAITERYETVLHIATGASKVDFATHIMSMMTPEDLTLQDQNGNTAFSIAAATGNIKIAEVMLQQNQKLLVRRSCRDMTPFHTAVLHGNEEMAKFLLSYGSESISILKPSDRVGIFFHSIKNDLYDIGLNLLEQHPDLAVTPETDYQAGETALHVLARKPPSIFVQQTKSSVIQKIMMSKTPAPTSALQLLKRIWEEAIRHEKTEDLIRNTSKLLFIAAKLGNFPFLAEIIRSYPTLVNEVDEKKRSIFHIAILHRHTSIFNIIYEIGYDMKLLATSVDFENNTILHLAAQYSADQPLASALPSAALEMQQELLIFREVEKLIQPSLREEKNAQDLTPRELFVKEHKSLMHSAEQWMRNTATASMVVATLIATVVFSAAFTVPGGQDGKTGMPILREKSLFLVFAISDALALSFSSFSLLMFLSILTSGYSQTDFNISLTLKLMIGLLTLFISVISMMISFSATFFLIYRDKLSSIPTFTLVFASFPIILFVQLQYPLVINILHLTHRSRSLFREHLLFTWCSAP